jgi:hypothetical protein
VEGRPVARIFGRTLSLKAEVVVHNGLSSHADHAGLLASLGPLAGRVRQARLVHGDPERSAALAERLRQAGFAEVAIPERGERVTVARGSDQGRSLLRDPGGTGCEFRPLFPCIPAALFNTPVDYESLSRLGPIMGSGGMIVLDQNNNIVDVARFFMQFW